MVQPDVLIIDDETTEQGAPRARRITKRGIVVAQAVHPDDVTLAQIKRARVILLDYKLTDWPERDALKQLGLKPVNGLALAGVLREHLPSHSTSAMCILSNQLAELYGDLHPENRRHVLSRIRSLEWVFDKNDTRLAEQVEDLVDAVERMTGTSPDSDKNLMKLLGLGSSARFASLAQDEVHRCIPPIDEMNELTHGLSFLRWLLQRVLPYPTFLIDENSLAAQLKIDVRTLRKIQDKKTSFAKRLEDVQYTGILRNFLGPRWWKAGVVDLMWSIGKEDALSLPAWIGCLAKASKVKIATNSAFVDPVVSVDDDFASTDNIISRSNAVRIVPDDWPYYAEPAFVTVDRARTDTHIKSIVHVDDEWRLEAAR